MRLSLGQRTTGLHQPRAQQVMGTGTRLWIEANLQVGHGAFHPFDHLNALSGRQITLRQHQTSVRRVQPVAIRFEFVERLAKSLAGGIQFALQVERMAQFHAAGWRCFQ